MAKNLRRILLWLIPLTLINAAILIISLLNNKPNEEIDTSGMDTIVDAWHLAAANADGNEYFGLMTEDAIFIGTDIKERWTKEEFESFAKPYFDKGDAWDFKPKDRTWYNEKDVVWFEERLDTWMGECFGSGVLKKENGKWKIAHYHLAFTVANEKIQSVLELLKEEANPAL